MFDRIEAPVAIALDKPGQIGCDKFGKLDRAEKRAVVKAIIRTKGKPVQEILMLQLVKK